MKTALFYGSTTGNTEDIAEQIQRSMEDVELFDVAEDSLDQLEGYDLIILGIPTWDYGEIQSEWQDIWDEIDTIDFHGKTVALYGLGDQIGYGEWFLDAMGLLHDKVKAQGARVIGYWPVEGYDFEESKAVTADGCLFVGLAIDEDCQHELTEERVETWLAKLKVELEQL
ncbi:flavodoxin FldB [Motiliproteus sp. MSK22-1]|uniref:flavodoxin FldB n=1 Tax=Motiliproteus sp. MSK22-1 TaxID=1897630 RepID=UPI00097B1409|nr:flavodoxin FldB [Motiliproteus sp. MSK22-1]OMH38291.1 flavodoxin [Motiliproteus sp. MSK22-1]